MPRRPVRLPLYAVIVLVVMSTLGPVLSIWASVAIAKGNTQQLVVEREKAKAAATEATRKLVCEYFAANLDGYDEVPPSTPAGKKQRKINLEFYISSGCLPTRE